MGLGGLYEGSVLRMARIEALLVLSLVKSRSSWGSGGHDLYLDGDIFEVFDPSEV